MGTVNTLAYYDKATITNVKSFITQLPYYDMATITDVKSFIIQLPGVQGEQ